MTFKIDFLGIGPPKAGTTWIGHMLEAHPQICMAEPKEVHFYNDSLSANNSFSRRHFSLGYDWYRKHWKHALPGQLLGEITPRYILDPVVPKRIFEHNPDIKLIVCLRNPFDRIVSQFHSFHDFHRNEGRSLSQMLRDDPEYILASMHFQQMRWYLEYFKLEQFFFVEMDSIKTQPEEVVHHLYEFLGVAASFMPDTVLEKSNPARATRSRTVRQLTTRIHRGIVAAGFSPAIRFLKALGIGNAINRINSRPIEKVYLSQEDKNYIREKLTSDVEQFSQLVGKDYSHWLK